MPAAHEISVIETLELLDSGFNGTVEALNAGELTLWIGSGISRDRFDMLPTLILNVLEFIRTRIDLDDFDCAHSIAFENALIMAGLSQAERDTVDVGQPIAHSPYSERLSNGLSQRYADFLNLRVQGEPNDYLVRHGIDVIGTYGDPDKEPDTEHFCIAALVLEGVIGKVASANWDGLIERAYQELAGQCDGLAVCVESTHLQEAGLRPKLIKFHGCAVLAREDPDQYHDLITARSSQLAQWGTRPRTGAISEDLKLQVQQFRTLMLGLSAQDSNIQKLFEAARQQLAWGWDPNNPAFVFSEDQLGGNQDALLENMYPNVYEGDRREEIASGSVIRAFAKPLLLALLLEVYAGKILSLIRRLQLDDVDQLEAWARTRLFALRDKIAALAPAEDVEKCGFTRSMQKSASELGRAIRFGPSDLADNTYQPITSGPTPTIEADPELNHNGLPEVSLAIAMVGHGEVSGDWSVGAKLNEDGVIEGLVAAKSTGETSVFLSSNGVSGNRLVTDGRVSASDDAIIIYGSDAPPRNTRSRRRGGEVRTGKPRLREIAMRTFLNRPGTPDELLARFRQETSL